MAENKYRGYDYIKSSSGIDEYRLLSNDLRVLLMEDHSAPVATFMVTYHVGSRNEPVGHTGSTHLLEHLMFKGSRKYNKHLKKNIWTILQNVGAQINATTWMDRTNYFELLPSEQLEEAIKIEADRMRYALIRDEDRQLEMTVVRNEFERGENDPFSVLDKQLWATAFFAHPYHHSTIGWRSDIENVSTERLKEFYDTFYWPNNSTVTIIGDFDTEEALAMVKRHFGRLRKSPRPIPEMYTEEPEQEGPRRIIVRRAGQTGIIGIAYKTPEGLHEDTYAIQVLSNILGGGKSSRLYKQIVDKGLATSLFMWDFPFHDNGLFISYVFLTPGTDHAEVEKLVLAEIEALQSNGVTADEMARAKAQILADEAFSRDGSYSIASRLNEAIAMGDWTFYTTFGERVKAVTAEDVQRVAKTYLIEDHSTTGYFIPKEETSTSNSGGSTPSQVHQPYNWSLPAESATFLGAAGNDQSSSEGTPIAAQIQDRTPIDGLRLLTMKTAVEDVVTITGSMLGGDEFSPRQNRMVADLTAAMLDQGTKKHSKFEISEELESVGAIMSFSSGQYRVRFRIRCLKQDIPLVIRLLAEQLREPAFHDDDLQTVKRRYNGSLQQAKESTRRQAGDAFLQLLYPEGHPNYSMGIDDKIAQVESITTKELKAYHETHYGLRNMILVAVGDIDGEQLAHEIKKNFQDWKKSPLDIVPTQLRAKAVEKQIEFVTMEDKTSTDTYIGQAIGIDRDHEDYYPYMVGVYILGGNFSARLMQTVRDEQGLTYGIGSSVRGVDNGNDGYWYTRGTFAPLLLEKGREATLEQIKMWVDEGVTAKELAAKKSTITGSYKVGLATTGGIAGQIITNAERGRPNEYLDQFPGIINSLTLEQVNGVINKYVKLDKLVTVTAGSIDEEGKPLEK